MLYIWNLYNCINQCYLNKLKINNKNKSKETQQEKKKKINHSYWLTYNCSFQILKDKYVSWDLKLSLSGNFKDIMCLSTGASESNCFASQQHQEKRDRERTSNYSGNTVGKLSCPCRMLYQHQWSPRVFSTFQPKCPSQPSGGRASPTPWRYAVLLFLSWPRSPWV